MHRSNTSIIVIGLQYNIDLKLINIFGLKILVRTLYLWTVALKNAIVRVKKIRLRNFFPFEQLIIFIVIECLSAYCAHFLKYWLLFVLYLINGLHAENISSSPHFFIYIMHDILSYVTSASCSNFKGGLLLMRLFTGPRVVYVCKYLCARTQNSKGNQERIKQLSLLYDILSIIVLNKNPISVLYVSMNSTSLHRRHNLLPYHKQYNVFK